MIENFTHRVLEKIELPAGYCVLHYRGLLGQSGHAVTIPVQGLVTVEFFDAGAVAAGDGEMFRVAPGTATALNAQVNRLAGRTQEGTFTSGNTVRIKFTERAYLSLEYRHSEIDHRVTVGLSVPPLTFEALVLLMARVAEVNDDEFFCRLDTEVVQGRPGGRVRYTFVCEECAEHHTIIDGRGFTPDEAAQKARADLENVLSRHGWRMP